ncbi:MAG: type I restriction endonuclease [Kiritimatiellaeota bacterium]|nr:type I restriction endonuclease [Kiritimatiellota bacterium]
MTGHTERETLNRIIGIFCDPRLLGYAFLGNKSGRENPNIEPDLLAANLKRRGFGNTPVRRAVVELTGAASRVNNKAVRNLLRHGAKVRDDNGETVTVNFIDWERTEGNDFAIAGEGAADTRPDLVVYVNGVALAVIMLGREPDDFTAPFFSTVRHVVAGDETNGAKYRALDSEENTWRELTNHPNHPRENRAGELRDDIRRVCGDLPEKPDLQLCRMFRKERFLALMRDSRDGAPNALPMVGVTGAPVLVNDRRTDSGVFCGYLNTCRYDDLDTTLGELDDLCEDVPAPREPLDFCHWFGTGHIGAEDPDGAYAALRGRLYKLVNRLIWAYSKIKAYMDAAGYSKDEQARVKSRVEFYIRLKVNVGQTSGDAADFKMFEPGVRHLIDTHIVAGDSARLGIEYDFTLLDFVVAQEARLESEGRDREVAAEAIENNIRRRIAAKAPLNPKYNARMTETLERLVADRKHGAVAYGDLLSLYAELAKNVANPECNPRYPEGIGASGALRMFYDNCGGDAALARELDAVVRESKQDGFRTHPAKRNKIKRALSRVINDETEVERLFDLIIAQDEY